MAKRDDVLKTSARLQSTLGIVVRACRQHLGITQEELAWRADLQRTYFAVNFEEFSSVVRELGIYWLRLNQPPVGDE